MYRKDPAVVSLNVERTTSPVRARSASRGPSRPKRAESSKTKAPSRSTVKGAPVAELTGIVDKKKPITHEDVWKFVKEHAGNQAHNVEIVPLENVALSAARPIPFTKMEADGRRSQVMWYLVNGCGRDHDRRLSTFLAEALKHGASTKRCPDLVAALNGGYSPSSKTWGTPFVKLRVTE